MEYLDLVSFFAHAKPPKPQEMRPCNQHEILLQLICNRRQSLSKAQMADLLWNMTSGPKKKLKRRQCGGMDNRNPSEPTDIEVVFGCRRKHHLPPFRTEAGKDHASSGCASWRFSRGSATRRGRKHPDPMPASTQV